jgi:hypothetical protein
MNRTKSLYRRRDHGSDTRRIDQIDVLTERFTTSGANRRRGLFDTLAIDVRYADSSAAVSE